MDESSSNLESAQDPSAIRHLLLQRTGLHLWLAQARSLSIPPGIGAWSAHAAGLAIMLLLVQAITGVLLLFHYRPGLHAADSVAALTLAAPFAWLIRGLHAYASHALVLLLLGHLAITYVLRAAQKPRELTWALGFASFALSLAMTLTGAILPGDLRAVTTARVAVHLLASLPLAGRWLANIAAGGVPLTADTMHRALAWHVAALPTIGLLFITMHVRLVRVHGLSRTSSLSAPPIPWYPDFLLRHIALFVLLFFTLLGIAALWPPVAPQPANPLQPTPAGLKPSWQFLPLYQWLRSMPPTLAGMRSETAVSCAVLLASACALVLPCQSGSRTLRRVTDVLAIAAGLAAIALGLLGWYR